MTQNLEAMKENTDKFYYIKMGKKVKNHKIKDNGSTKRRYLQHMSQRLNF